MSELRLIVAGVALDLPEDISINIEWNSPLIGERQFGSLSFPFSLRITARNANVFRFSHLVSVKNDRRGEFDANIECGPLVFSGLLRVTELSNEFYACNLVCPPANVPERTWSKKVRSLALGQHQFTTTTTRTNFVSAGIPEDAIRLGPLSGSTQLSLFVGDGNTAYFSYSYLFEPGSERASNETVLNAFATAFTEEISNFPTTPPKYVASVHGANLTLQVNEEQSKSLIHRLQIKTSARFSGNGPARSRTTSFILPWVSTENVSGRQAFGIAGKFESPMLRNPGLYDPAKNAGFCGFVNYYDTELGKDVMATNSPNETTRYALMPCLYLNFALASVAQFLGFSIDLGKLAQDPELSRLLIIHNVPLDKQATGLGLPYNVFNADFQFAQAMPDVSVYEFFGLLDFLAARPLWDPQTGKVRIVFMADVLIAPSKLDWSNRLLRFFSLIPGDEQPRRLRINLNSGNELERETEPTFESYPPTSTGPNTTEFRDVILNLATWFQKVTTTGSVTNQAGYTRPGADVASIVTRHIAQAKQRGRSPFFEQTEIAAGPARLLFHQTRILTNEQTGESGGLPGNPSQSAYNDLFENDPSAARMPRSTGDNSTDRFSLFLNGPTGIHQKFWRKNLEFISSTLAYKPPLHLNELDLARLRWEDKIYIDGQDYLIGQLRFELTARGIIRPVQSTLYGC